MITEIVSFQLKAGASLADPNTAASKVIREKLAPSLKDAGAHEVYYGQLIEKPENGYLFINWDSVDDHKKFMSAPVYPTFLTHFHTITSPSTAPTVLHVPFSPSPSPSPALGAHPSVTTTEIVFFYFPSSLPPATKSAIMSSIDKMRPVVARSEALALYDGWAVEEDVRNPGPNAEEGEKSQVWVNLVGWVDVDAHMRFQGSEDFATNIHHLLGIKEMRHTELGHAKVLKA